MASEQCNNGQSRSAFHRSLCANPEQLVLASAAISIAITQGRTTHELETLLNLLSLVRENTQRILAQQLICDQDTVSLELDV